MPPKESVGKEAFAIFREMMDARFDTLEDHMDTFKSEILLNRENGQETKEFLMRHAEREEDDRKEFLNQLNALRVAVAEVGSQFVGKKEFEELFKTVEANKLFITRLKWSLTILGVILGIASGLFSNVIASYIYDALPHISNGK